MPWSCFLPFADGAYALQNRVWSGLSQYPLLRDTIRPLSYLDLRPAMKRISSSFLPPIALDSRASTPMYQQLYEWFRRAILQGQLRPGQRVPSTRNLAAELKVSRIPVSSAYEQLQAEGYFETFVGAGTCVARTIPANAAKPEGGESRAVARPAAKRAAKGTAPRKISRRAMAMRMPPQLARARAISRRRLVQAGESPFAAATAPAHGLRPRHGPPAVSRSHRGIFGNRPCGALRRLANFGDNRFAAWPAIVRAGPARRRRSGVDRRARLPWRAPRADDRRREINSGAGGSRRSEHRGGNSPRAESAGRLHHAFASIPAGLDHERHSPHDAAELGHAQRRLDHRRRLRQRIPVRRPPDRVAARSGHRRARDLHRHFQQGGLSVVAAGLCGDPERS